MKIMITGGLGFIGSHLVDSLSNEKHEIIILTRSLSKKKNLTLDIDKNNITILKIDIQNFKKFSNAIIKYKPDILFHLAGETSHSNSFLDPMSNIDSNIKSTICALETIQKNKIKCRFILGSTFVTIGKPVKLPVDENSICNPTTIYGASKLTSENLCKIYNNVYDVDTVIFRITNSFGPREQVISKKNAINYLIYTAFNGEKITIFNKGEFFRDLIYVSDVISALQIIMKKGKPGNLYWISSGKKTWFYKFGNLLTKNTGTKVVFTPTPKYTKKIDVGNFVVNNAKLKKLGWKPKVSIELGIIKTLDYFNSQK
jgi:nucleoside-diphosphate-sugar epimerase